MQFLDTAGTLATARTLLQRAEKAVFAVAYWGEGAIERLGIDTASAKKLTIVCDLESGACNPSEIEELHDLGCRILYLSGLHAKVFWSESAVIVGSSNVSANGLGFEGSEPEAANVEAGMWSEDAAVVEASRVWIDESVLHKAEPLTAFGTDPFWVRCRAAWQRRRDRRHTLIAQGPRGSETLWERLESNPEYFQGKRIYVWIYDSDDLPTANKKAVRTRQSELGLRALDCWYYDEIDPDIQPGDVIIEALHEKGKLYESLRMWEILRHEPWQEVSKGKTKSYNLLCVPKKSYDDFLFKPKHFREAIRKTLQVDTDFAESLYDFSLISKKTD